MNVDFDLILKIHTYMGLTDLELTRENLTIALETHEELNNLLYQTA